MSKAFTVSKYIVNHNRKGFEWWALQNGKVDLFEKVSKEWINLEEFPNDRVLLDVVSHEIRRTINLADEPNLGLKVIAITDLKLSPFYKILEIALSPALKNNIDVPMGFFLRLVSSYYQILTEVVSIELHEFRNGIKLVFKPNLPELVTYHQIEGAMFGVSRLIAQFKSFWPNNVEFMHTPNIIDSDLYLKTFKSIPTFHCPTNQLTYTFLLKAPRKEHQLLINPLIHSIDKQFPETSYREKIKILLWTTLGFIPPNRQNIASLMSLSVKTLQRRLSEEGHTFNEILLHVRKKRAIEYIRSQQFSLQQIGLLLGYKAKSQFLKAFNSWFGMTPNQYKARVLHLAPYSD
ncbi:helix-turn-helix transcriptional regulator [Acinetobacter suaedae]|uniref:Helix-turn-helix transcriptional regulator n=1 Tax=Acinetobacter suaedae TaxID=2609668 RepID=A0A5P1USF4_9GAMM|nr:helix-turn-helix transcriptional regulator [Acinetobacter sp. C16S1]QER39655.1 helix-turn-helix transcriptional regulator [Acinetobacter sp. C16S1]